jgi:poly-gamma-glutamate capsule biosynthesis protein CapA/YwtB (metallophosphatase superfamily)
MPRARSILILACLAVTIPLTAQQGPETRLLFTGDILLSRQVRREIELTRKSPWSGFADLFRSATWVAGNLEGAVGTSEQCTPAESESPCFDVAASMIPLLGNAGFRAIGMANNHSSDLGPAGRSNTRTALRDSSIEALSFEDSPAFATFGGHTVAIVALSTVRGRDGSRVEIPSTALRQKMRLARTLAELVVVYIHWGSELLDWPNTGQREAAGWLIQNGADLIVGHHPHVVQNPECVQGRPVFFSLGNFVFDQKYPETKEGLIADCRIRGGVLSCASIATSTPPASAIPQLSPGSALVSADALKACPVNLSRPLSVNGFALHGRTMDGRDGKRRYSIEGTRDGMRPWRSQDLPLLSAEAGRLAGSNGPEYLFTLEEHPSTIDGEEGVRPYVYEALPSGLVARWRGSALAWPLLDAALLPNGDGVLCALHRRDSFLVLQPNATGVRPAAYRWNGFGFSGIDDTGILARCRAIFGAAE